MSATPEILQVGQAWARALKARYRGRLPDSLDAKRCARAFEVSPRTAESWGDGQAPLAKHLFQACRLHGPAFLLEVFAPASEVLQLARLDDAIGELEAKFRTMGDDLARLRLVRGK